MDRIGVGWSGLGCFGLVCTRLHWLGLVCARAFSSFARALRRVSANIHTIISASKGRLSDVTDREVADGVEGTVNLRAILVGQEDDSHWNIKNS